MQYNLKTGNFCDFSKFRENIMIPRSYFIPFANLDELAKTDIRNERYSSSRVECLSGEWDFVYYSNCKMVDNFFDTEKIKFDKEKFINSIKIISALSNDELIDKIV